MTVKDVKSPFKFVGFTVEESHIIRKSNDSDETLNIGIDPSGEIHVEKKEFHLTMKVKVWEESKRFDVDVKLVGFFDFKDVVDMEHISNYFFTNAPAIMFPYVRAYIASLTALSGMEAIHLPPIMMGHYKKELIENTTEIKS